MIKFEYPFMLIIGLKVQKGNTSKLILPFLMNIILKTSVFNLEPLQNELNLFIL